MALVCGALVGRTTDGWMDEKLSLSLSLARPRSRPFNNSLPLTVMIMKRIEWDSPEMCVRRLALYQSGDLMTDKSTGGGVCREKEMINY